MRSPGSASSPRSRSRAAAPARWPNGIHDIMRSVGAQYDVEVAESYGDLAPADWVGGADCLHPDDSGYAKVAQSFADVLVS